MNTANILALNAATVPNTHPAFATFYAAWTAQLDANWGVGVLTVTPFAGAAIAGGALDLGGSTSKYVTFDALNNASSYQTGTIDFLWTPNYAGSPADPQPIVNISQQAGNANNWIDIEHFTDGNLYFQVFDNAGVVRASVIHAFVPVAHTTYRITARFNGAGGAGATSLAIDSVVVGSSATAFVRSGAITYGVIGQYYNGGFGANADFSISNFAYYSQSVVPPLNPVLNPAAIPAVTSAAIDARFVLSATVQATFTDSSASGTIKLQDSNDPGPSPTNWVDIPSATATVTAGALAMTPILAPNFCYQWIRMAFVPTGGAGTITAYVHTMGA